MSGKPDAPEGLQLDLLTAVVRLEQLRGLLTAGHVVLPFDLWSYLLTERILRCDLPRLRGHLTADTLAWEAEHGD